METEKRIVLVMFVSKQKWIDKLKASDIVNYNCDFSVFDNLKQLNFWPGIYAILTNNIPIHLLKLCTFSKLSILNYGKKNA